MVLQAKVNGLLGAELENGVLAAQVSFGSGLLIIALVMALRKSTRSEIEFLRTSVRAKNLPWWFLLAGSLGGFFVITQGLTAGLLGISIFTMSVVTGQSISAVLIDSLGLLGMTAVRLNVARIIGVLLTGVGLVVTNLGTEGSLSWQVLMPLIAGAGIGFQQAMNGKIGKESQSPLLATLINFMVGSAIIALVLIFTGINFGNLIWPSNPWLYLGGLIGVVFIFAQVVIVRIIGVLAMGISLLFGQLATSVIIDILIPTGHNPFALQNIVGLTLVGIGALFVIRKR